MRLVIEKRLVDDLSDLIYEAQERGEKIEGIVLTKRSEVEELYTLNKTSHLREFPKDEWIDVFMEISSKEHSNSFLGHPIWYEEEENV